MRSPDYRPDVDGLRALAVLSVLLYHADLGCTGGFVGVDIFFVISGFLITSLILKELNDGSFSLITFWERRVRRILPALIVVIVATLVSGWVLYLPEDLASLGSSVMAQATLVSNIFFSLHTGYFEAASDTKPLLHTWSLAVEEQFYMFFPVLLILLARFKFPIIKTILCLIVGSFALSVADSHFRPSAAFYFLQSRAWELMLGALLAAVPEKRRSVPWLSEVAGMSGFGLILYSIIFYSHETRFPGAAAIPPCLGAALIIRSGSSRVTVIGRLLALEPVVFVGLISYSLYLWHWPLLVFSKYISAEELSWKLRVVLLATSLALSILSWKFIETPFRKRRVYSRRPEVFAFAGFATLTLMTFGGFIYFAHGIPSRLPPRALTYLDCRNDKSFRNEITLQQVAAGRFVELGTRNTNQPIEILIWGDSHAMAVTPVLDELCRQFSVRGVQVTHSATAPVLGYVSTWRLGFKDQSPEFTKSVVDFICERRVKTVIISARWTNYGPPDLLSTGLASTIQTLAGSGARVYVLKDVPFPGFDVPRHVAMTVFHQGDLARLAIDRDRHLVASGRFDSIFDHASKAGATVLNPAQYFLNTNGSYDVFRDGKVLYWDSHHLSVAGSQLLKPMFDPLFRSHTSRNLNTGIAAPNVSSVLNN